jgi:hypothetical protein
VTHSALVAVAVAAETSVRVVRVVARSWLLRFRLRLALGYQSLLVLVERAQSTESVEPRPSIKTVTRAVILASSSAERPTRQAEVWLARRSGRTTFAVALVK